MSEHIIEENNPKESKLSNGNGFTYEKSGDTSKLSLKLPKGVFDKLLPYIIALLAGDTAIERLTQPTNNVIDDNLSVLEKRISNLESDIEEIKDLIKEKK